MSEWSKEHAWKVCMSKGIEGSNPSLTATLQESLLLCRLNPGYRLQPQQGTVFFVEENI